MDGTTSSGGQAAGPLSDEELRLLDAYWRAANYLSVGQIYLLDNPLLREPLQAGARQAAAARPFRHGAGSQPRLRAPEPGDPRPRPRRDLRHGAGARRPGERRQRLPRGNVRELYPAISEDEDGLRQAVPPVLVPRRRPQPRRAGDPWLDPRGRRARLRPRACLRCGLRQSRAPRRLRRRRRRGRDRPARGELALEQVPQPRARRRRPADPPPERLQDRQPDRARAHPRGGARRALRGLRLGAAPRLRRLRRRGSARACISGSRRRSTWRSTGSRPSSWTPVEEAATSGRAGRCSSCARRRAGRGRARSTASRSRAPGVRTRCPLAGGARRPRAPAPARGVAAELPARGALRRAGPPHARAAELAPAGRRRMSANPHANGGELLRDLVLPDFREYAVEVPLPGKDTAEATRVLGTLPPRRDRAESRRRSGSSGPTRPSRTGSATSSRVTSGPGSARRRRRTRGWSPDGRVMEILSEHLCQGWLEGYLLTGRHGLFSSYEAFIHVVDSMFNQHAKWLKTTPRDRVAPTDRVAQLPPQLARLAPGPQRLLAPGPRVHRPRREQERRGDPRLPAARRQHASLGRRPLPAEPELRQRRRRRQAARAHLPLDRRRDRALHARARDLGVGVERRGRRARRRPRLLR